jgi:hypothetical protein
VYPFPNGRMRTGKVPGGSTFPAEGVNCIHGGGGPVDMWNPYQPLAALA